MIDRRLLYAAYRLSSMHRGPDGSSKEIHGTCFLIKSGTDLFAATNRHNLDLAYKDQKWLGYGLEGFMIAGYSDNNQYYETFAVSMIPFVFSKNASEDVAVFALTGGQMQYRRRRRPGEPIGASVGPPQLFSADIDMLATDDDLQRLAAGAMIVMPSYSLHYDKSSERPVMRFGIISSDPLSDYQTEGQEVGRRILLQVQSASGASGAPIFAQLDEGAVLIGANAGQLLVGGMPSGFSYCFKAQCIRECIDQLIALRTNPPKTGS
jgi:hypothetical protein